MRKYNCKEVGERLKELRLDKKVGQNKLAKELNLSNSSISCWENGKQVPSASALFALAQYFNTSADYILGLTD